MEVITKKLSTEIETPNLPFIDSTSKAIAAVFPYAVWRQRNGNSEMFDTFLRLSTAVGPEWRMWHHIEPFVSTLLPEESDDFLKLATVLASPRINFGPNNPERHNPGTTEADVQPGEGQYPEPGEALQGVDGRAVGDPDDEPPIASSSSIHSMLAHE